MDANNTKITYFRTLNKDEGSITLAKYHEMVSRGFTRDAIEQIRRYDAQGNDEETAHLKKKLPGITAAALFEGGRRSKYFTSLSGLTVIDIDELDDEECVRIFQAACIDEHVLHVCRSSRGHGLKIIAAYQLKDGRKLPVVWGEADSCYRSAYSCIAAYFEQQLCCEVDKCGKDITRLNFISYDPEAYFCPTAQPFIVEDCCISPVKIDRLESTITPKRRKVPKEVEVVSPTIKRKRQAELLNVVYRNLYREEIHFEPGNRHQFMVLVAHTLNEYGVPFEDVGLLVEESTAQLHLLAPDTPLLPAEELRSIIHDIYANGKDKFNTKRINKPLRNQIYMKVEIDRHFELRFNTLSERIEIKKRKGGDNKFHYLTDKNINDLLSAAKEMGIQMETEEIRKIFESSFAPDFDPLVNYLDACPEWDGHDHLKDFSDSIVVNNQAHFELVMKMWFVGMVKTYFDDERVNNIMPVIYTGSQGEGKTWSINHVLPPELSPYMITPSLRQLEREEFGRYIAQKLCIFVDEMQTLHKDHLDKLQGDITVSQLDYRLPYAHFGTQKPHRASFIGACNSTSFMRGKHGNRRYHTFEAMEFKSFEPNYQQMFAQIKQLIADNFKYYFTAAEQDELAAYAHNFEHNDIEYDMLLKYVRFFPTDYQEVKAYKVSELLKAFNFYNPSIETGPGAVQRLTCALKRWRVPSKFKRNSNIYFCYILTANQVEYIEQVMENKSGYSVEYEKIVPLEILVAHREASIADIQKANDFLIETQDFEKSKELYAAYLREKGEEYSTNTDRLPF